MGRKGHGFRSACGLHRQRVHRLGPSLAAPPDWAPRPSPPVQDPSGVIRGRGGDICQVAGHYADVHPKTQVSQTQITLYCRAHGCRAWGWPGGLPGCGRPGQPLGQRSVKAPRLQRKSGSGCSGLGSTETRRRAPRWLRGMQSETRTSRALPFLKRGRVGREGDQSAGRAGGLGHREREGSQEPGGGRPGVGRGVRGGTEWRPGGGAGAAGGGASAAGRRSRAQSDSPLAVRGQHAHQLPHAVVQRRPAAVQTHHQVVLAARVQHHQLVPAAGHAQPRHLRGAPEAGVRGAAGPPPRHQQSPGACRPPRPGPLPPSPAPPTNGSAEALLRRTSSGWSVRGPHL